MELEEIVESSAEFYIECRACFLEGSNVSEWFPVNV